MFEKILIANRGEIAVRVIRACREMGITAVAVYSEADREALHVRLADEAYAIGPPAAAESYLSLERILAAVETSGAEAVHPGYGFLSENPLLPEACAKAGVVFIGPGAEAMRLMGNKVTARRAMIAAGVPVVPGTGALSDDPAAAREAVENTLASQGAIFPGGSSGSPTTRSPYPILLKAAAGGGGKGMRIVPSAREFASAFAQARSEARSSFGDPSLYAERYVTRPRHIEVQVLADVRGTVVHLGERECTIQRRHQKLVEESPSPVVTEALRAELGERAVRAARAASYVGAGTCEFLRDESGAFYFMEMNARLQVEHAVTEMVTGIDLVKLQIRIAAGEPIPFSQTDVALRGWAIECRIFAEDPSRGFLPSPGKIGTLRVPSGPGIRDDGGVYQGYTVPVHYDPMISKLIAWGESREEAVSRMRRALDEYRIEGVRTTIPFHRRLMRHPAFLAGDLDTSFIEEHGNELMPGCGRPAGDRSAGEAAGKEGTAASPKPVGASRRRKSGAARPATRRAGGASDSPNGRPLSLREVAVIAAAIAAFRKAESEGSFGGQETGSAGARDRSGAWSGVSRSGGWKLAARLAALRDR